MCNVNYTKFPCMICAKTVPDKDKAVQCDTCEFRIHIKCNNINYLGYRYLQNCDESWYCKDFAALFFPLTPYQLSNVSWLVLLVVIVTSYS